MKNKKRRRVRTQYLITAVLGIVMTVIFIFVAIFPNTNEDETTLVPTLDAANTIPTLQPTSIVAPTPDSGTPQITLLEHRIHSTGLFQFLQPGDDWRLERDDYNTDYRRGSLIYVSPSRLAVVHAFVEIGTNYPTLQMLSDNLYTDVHFDSEWAQYGGWEMTNREVSDRFVTLEFALQDERNARLSYISRQISWLEADWLYTIRIVVPNNNPVLLNHLFDLAMPTMIGYRNIAVFPLLGWKQFSDIPQRLMIKLQEVWTLVGGSSGRPMTYAGATLTQGYEVTMQRFTGQPLDSLEAAQAWITNFRPGAAIIEGQVTQQTFASGYWFSYSYTNPDGEAISAAASLLNDDEGNLYIAELRSPESGVNFLGADLQEQQLIGQQTIQSFTVLAPVGYVATPGTPVQSFEAPTESADTTPEARPFGG